MTACQTIPSHYYPPFHPFPCRVFHVIPLPHTSFLGDSPWSYMCAGTQTQSLSSLCTLCQWSTLLPCLILWKVNTPKQKDDDNICPHILPIQITNTPAGHTKCAGEHTNSTGDMYLPNVYTPLPIHSTWPENKFVLFRAQETMQHVWLSSVLLKKMYTKQLLHRVVTVNRTIQRACTGKPYLFQRQVLFKMAGRCLIVSAVTVIRDANSSSRGTTLTATWVLSNFITSSLAPFEKPSAKRCLPHMALPTTLSCRLEPSNNPCKMNDSC